uniref:Endonuclease/exonuclease/phosphatase domain-containing protein n=1 Tax=Biomphalaria glabrata TaxID=6526 RepID=A0A2C9LI22_BIOGL
MVGNVIGFKPVSDRLCSLRLKGKFFNISFINIHAPTEDADDSTKEAFYDELERIYDEAPKHDIKIVLGDFNAKIGKEPVFRPIGIRLVDFASICSTKFQHKNIHKVTWISPDGNTQNQIDHILIDKRHGSDILDVRNFRGANADSDHVLVKT